MRGVIVSLSALHVIACASARWKAPSEDVQRAAVNGTEIAYTVDGTGMPLVIIHGGWGDFRSFSRAAPILAEHHAVVRVSLRHHWPNQAPESERAALAVYRADVHAADVAGLIERFGLGPAIVLGHSYGGIVAALVAQSRPDLVGQMVLVEPSLYGLLREYPGGVEYIQAEKEWSQRKLAGIREGQAPLEIGRVIYDAARPGTFESFSEIRRAIFIANARTVRPVLINNWADVPYTCADARQIKMPVLLVEGEKTGADMREINSRLLGCMPDARRVVLPNTGHAIQFDAPEAMARAVARFIGR